ncbi:MAG: box helicase, partial [Devosia sp.]|nr:box helicase [Devosia sp.]
MAVPLRLHLLPRSSILMNTRKLNPHAGARMEPVGLPSGVPTEVQQSDQPPSAGVAFRLAERFRTGSETWIYLTSSERRAEETTRALTNLLPVTTVLHLPAWDCLPYDRAPPSREIMGKRMQVLRRCLENKGPLVLVLSAEAAIQKLPPADVVASAVLVLSTGQSLDREALEQFALRTGYTIDDRVDEPGEIALRGNVIDVFPADADEPVRITDVDGVVQSIMRYDPRTQRTLDEMDSLELGPASEVIKDPEERMAGQEHRLAEHYEALASIFDYLPKAQLVFAGPVPERFARVHEQVMEAHDSADQFAEAHPLGIARLYFDQKSFDLETEKRERVEADVSQLEAIPSFAAERFPGRVLANYIR